MDRLTLTCVSLSFSCALTPLAWSADQLSIRSLAPHDSVIVIGADDLQATRERWTKTPLAAWWNDPETQAATKEWREDMEKGMSEWTQELGVPREALTCPASVGAAAFLQVNEDTGAAEPAFIAFIDWGSNSEGFGQIYDAAISKVEKEKPMPFTVEEMKGRRVYVFEQPKPVEAQGNGDLAPADPLASMKVCVTRDAGRLLVTGGTSAMGDLLSRVDGGKAQSVGDNDDFKGTMELVGASQDVYGAIVTEKFFAFMNAMQPESMFMMAMVGPFIQPLVGDIRGWGMGLSLDTAKHPMSQSLSVYIPGGKVGLLSLFGTSTVQPVPSVVPGDAASYGRVNVKISGITKVIEDVIARMPPEMSDMIRQNVDPIMPQLKSSFAAMGDSVHMWSPAAAGGAAGEEPPAGMTAIPITDAKAAQGLLDVLGAGGMLKPRDFLGNTIYSTDSPMDPAFGFSAQYMLMGPSREVEVALRALGGKDNSSLGADPNYQAAAATWSKEELVAWGFSNPIDTLESLEAMQDVSPMVPLDAVPGEVDFDAFENALKPEFLKKFFGPTSWQVSSPKTGFRADFFVLGADAKAAEPATKR